MSKLYLLSSIELNAHTSVYEEIFYTVDNNLNLVSIGTTKDFSKGFDADVLATVDNSVYSQLNEGKVYVNGNPDSEASILSSGGALIVSGPEYAVPCTAKGIKKLYATCTGDPRFAISFDNGVNWYSMTNQEVLMPGSIVSGSVDISSSGEYIIPAGTLPADTEKLVMKLGQTGDTLPVRVSIQGRMTGGSSWTNLSSFYVEEVTSEDFDITENLVSGYDEYRIYIQKVKDVGGSYVDDATPLTFHVINLDYTYVDSSVTDWEVISLDEIESKGMSASDMAAIGYTDYAPIYTKTQLSFAAFVPSGSTLTDFVVEFPFSVTKQVDFEVTISNPISTEMDFDVSIQNKTFDVIDFEYIPVLSAGPKDVAFDLTVKNGIVNEVSFDVTVQVLMLKIVDFDVTPMLPLNALNVDFDFTGILPVNAEVDYDIEVKVGLPVEISIDVSVARPVACEIYFKFGAGNASTFWFFT